MRTTYAEQAPSFLAHYLPGLDPRKVRYVPHHVAHAASAGLAAPYPTNSVLVPDGRGEAVSHLAGRDVDGKLDVLAGQRLPHSLGLLYEDLTDHLGFLRSFDEYKVMAMAGYGTPRFAAELAQFVHATGRRHRLRAPARRRRRRRRGARGQRHRRLVPGPQRVRPRALGRRSLLNPRPPGHLERMNYVKGREQFRPVAPMVLAERAPHVDGRARIQTIDRAQEPLVARMLECFERRTGLPVVVNASLDTAGRPMVDDPRDGLEYFGSTPVDLLAIGPFVGRRPRPTPADPRRTAGVNRRAAR